jgi:hypothetical protein
MAIFTIRELSLRQRLLLLTMVTSAIGVLFGCLAFLLYDFARSASAEGGRATVNSGSYRHELHGSSHF